MTNVKDAVEGVIGRIILRAKVSVKLLFLNEFSLINRGGGLIPNTECEKIVL